MLAAIFHVPREIFSCICSWTQEYFLNVSKYESKMVSFDINHRFLKCDDFFFFLNVWGWEGGREKELTTCYSDCREDVWVKPLKITKVGIISRHFISLTNLMSLNFTALVHRSREKLRFSAGFNTKNFKRNLARGQNNIWYLMLLNSNIWQDKHCSFDLITALP